MSTASFVRFRMLHLGVLFIFSFQRHCSSLHDGHSSNCQQNTKTAKQIKRSKQAGFAPEQQILEQSERRHENVPC